MTRTRIFMATVAVATLACGTGDGIDGPPQFVRYEIVEGVPACAGCPLTGPRLGPDADGTLTFRYDAEYTVRTVVRTGGHRDRCSYHMVWFSWQGSNHSFNCMDERGTSLEMDFRVPTTGFIVRSRSEPLRLEISLTEYETETRRQLSRQHLHTFPVRFEP